MGGRAGGGAGMGRGSRGLQSGATERGMSRQLAKSVLAKEADIMSHASESLHVFDDKGKETYTAYSKPGSPYAVEYDGKSVANKVVTHNHPRALGKKGWESMGNSFSSPDLEGMVHNNMKEMRAVTPKYTFSMKRPKKGWGATAAQVKAHYQDVLNKTIASDRKHLKSMSGASMKAWWDADARMSSSLYHRVNKQVAKDFGWTYTKKKNK